MCGMYEEGDPRSMVNVSMSKDEGSVSMFCRCSEQMRSWNLDTNLQPIDLAHISRTPDPVCVLSHESCSILTETASGARDIYQNADHLVHKRVAVESVAVDPRIFESVASITQLLADSNLECAGITTHNGRAASTG